MRFRAPTLAALALAVLAALAGTHAVQAQDERGRNDGPPPRERGFPRSDDRGHRNSMSDSVRRVRSESPSGAVRSLEDTPFYQRGLVTQTHQGQPVLAFHESLSVPRLTHPLVQAVLPWRMPRKTRA